MSAARSLAAGLVSGALLSFAREPLGADLVHVVGADPHRAAVARAAGLLAVAVGIQRARGFAPSERSVAAWLGGTALGFALHAFALQQLWWPAMGLWMLAVLVAGSLAITRALGSACASARAIASGRAPSPEAEPDRLERTGLLLAGGGGAIALEVLARHLRLFGLAAPGDDSVFALVLALIVAIGALAFAPLLARRRASGAASAALVAAGTASALLGYKFLGDLCQPGALALQLRRFGLDTAFLGMLPADALLAASTFVAPAFAIGTALARSGHRVRLASLLAGAAIGTLAVPHLYASTVEPLDLAAALRAPGGARWIAVAATVAGAGTLLAAAADRAGGGRRWIWLVPAGAAAVIPWVLPQRAVLPFSPWLPFPVEPLLVIDAPEGLATIEPVGSSVVATLDRVRLTPFPWEEEADLARLRRTAEIARSHWNGQWDVLLVGLPTPARVQALLDGGFGDVRWSAPWPYAAAALAEKLFEDAPELTARFLVNQRAGPGFEPRAWNARETWIGPWHAARGAYNFADSDGFNFAVAPALYGTALSSLAAGRPQLAAPPAPPHAAWIDYDGPSSEYSTALVWLDAASGLDARSLGGEVVLSITQVDQLAVGLLLHPRWAREPQAARPVLYPAGARSLAPRELARLLDVPKFRDRRERARLAERLAAGAEGTDHASLARGLALLYAGQAENSPWEDEAQQIEIDPAALGPLRDAALARPPDAFVRELWDELARLLMEKRMPDLILEHVAPLAARYPPWPALERAVARAHLEFGQPELAVPVLTGLAAESPFDISLLLDTALALRQAGDHAAEAGTLRQALAVQPDRPDIQRLLGMALMRAGDPEGRRLVEDALLSDPDDAELQRFLEPGPLPSVERGFVPPHKHAH